MTTKTIEAAELKSGDVIVAGRYGQIVEDVVLNPDPYDSPTVEIYFTPDLGETPLTLLSHEPIQIEAEPPLEPEQEAHLLSIEGETNE